MKYDNEKRIALFVNDKQGNEKRPDYTGKITLDGVDYKISMWKRSKDNKTYLSGVVEENKKEEVDLFKEFAEENEELELPF